jgi:hypothetical protein
VNILYSSNERNKELIYIYIYIYIYDDDDDDDDDFLKFIIWLSICRFERQFQKSSYLSYFQVKLSHSFFL